MNRKNPTPSESKFPKMLRKRTISTHQARAKAMCAKCPVSLECLNAALNRKELWGIWGGELIENGRVMVGKRGRGRPPKEPRPVVEINEVPIPPELIPA